MARYIDLEEFEKRINENIKPEIIEEKALIEWCKDECIRQGYAMPTADVAPKSEVVREIFAEIEKTISNLKYRANTPRKTVRVEELKEQVDWVLHEVVPKTIAELKKKYPGVEDGDGRN